MDLNEMIIGTSTDSLNTSFQQSSNSSSTHSVGPSSTILIAFHIGQVISLFSVVAGIFGNLILIFTICRSSFHYLPYGLFLFSIAIFDIVRLISTVFYYLLHARFIPVNLTNVVIYVAWYRYPKLVTNWLKVFLAIERLIAVKYSIARRYNVHSQTNHRTNQTRRNKILLFIFIFLLCCLFSQHPNFIPNRFSSSYISSTRLLIVNVPNPNFYYGSQPFRGSLFTIISYIVIDDLLPITLMILCNSVLVYQLRQLPVRTSQKLVESIFVLFLMTICSIFVAPRSFIVLFNLYANPKQINDTILSVAFHSFQGLEMLNHAITGYTCFFMCRNLRQQLFQIVRILKSQWISKRSSNTIDLHLTVITSSRF